MPPARKRAQRNLSATVDPAELAHFSRLAGQWWDPRGPWALEQRGWLRREPDPRDGRSTVARLTDSGWEVVRAAAPGHVEAVRRLVIDGLTPAQMEALTAVSVAALTVYDMCKAVDRGMTVERVRLEEKSGGKSGTYRRSD